MDGASPFNESAGELKALVVEGAGGRLDAWIASALAPDFSRSRIKVLVKQGHVTLNGAITVEPNQKLSDGDRIEILLPEAEDPVPKGEDIPLEVLYEDADLIVVNKPPRLVVHPAAGNWTGTLVNALIHHCGDSLSGIGGVKRPGIVHRLDKDTSGVMVVAKNDLSHRHPADQFADHGRTGDLERAYKAIVWGRPDPLNATIDAPLGRSRDRLKRAVRTDNGEDVRHAVTHYTVTERYGEASDATAMASLVECRLETGRTHQIRVHMAHIGHPLIGDRDYGMAFRTKSNKLPPEIGKVIDRFPRQALHAWLLAFEHPSTGEVMRFEADLPEDMEEVRTALASL